jgi:hypothetical protein
LYKITVTAKTEGPVFQQGRPREIIRGNLLSALWESILFIEYHVKENTPVGVFGDAGLRGSIFGEVREDDPLTLLGVVSSPLPYAEAVELGTKPHTPPIAPLILWAERVLGLSDTADDKAATKAAYAVRGAIRERGTGGKYMFRRGLEVSRERVERIFEAAGFNIAVEMNGGDFDYITPPRRPRPQTGGQN